ncbi:MAG: glycerophosphodiester phosphodiesterase [Promethearchaeati archaeon]
MSKPIIFGHRGASGYCIENTINSFKTAVKMNANIETDLRLTKDNFLICFHDPGFKINKKWYKIKNITLQELKNLEFKDHRKIFTLEEVLEYFNGDSYIDLLYSFDIVDINAGFQAIKLAKKYNILNNIIITDTRVKLLSKLRDFNKKVKLVHTIPHNIPILKEEKIPYKFLKDIIITTLNIKANRFLEENVKFIKKSGFKCFVWGVNSKIRMKKVLNLNKKGYRVKAIYTDYPDKLYKLKIQI